MFLLRFRSSITTLRSRTQSQISAGRPSSPFLIVSAPFSTSVGPELFPSLVVEPPATLSSTHFTLAPPDLTATSFHHSFFSCHLCQEFDLRVFLCCRRTVRLLPQRGHDLLHANLCPSSLSSCSSNHLSATSYTP